MRVVVLHLDEPLPVAEPPTLLVTVPMYADAESRSTPDGEVITTAPTPASTSAAPAAAAAAPIAPPASPSTKVLAVAPLTPAIAPAPAPAAAGLLCATYSTTSSFPCSTSRCRHTRRTRRSAHPSLRQSGFVYTFVIAETRWLFRVAAQMVVMSPQAS